MSWKERNQEKMGLTLGVALGAKSVLQKVRNPKEGVAETPWSDVASVCKEPLAQICGFSDIGKVFLQDTLSDAPLQIEEHCNGGSLPCVAFNSKGVFSASQSFQELCGRSWERLGGMDLRKVPLHSLLPNQQHRKLNNKPWAVLEKLHQQSFSQHTQVARSGSKQKITKKPTDRLQGFAKTKSQAEQQGLQATSTSANLVVSEEEENMHRVEVALMVCPGRRGTAFWNLLHAFSTDYRGEPIVVHVLMPLKTAVPQMLWMPKETPDAVNPGPAPDVLRHLEVLMQRLRCKLPDLQREESLHVSRLPKDALTALSEACIVQGVLKTTQKKARLRFGDDDSRGMADHATDDADVEKEHLEDEDHIVALHEGHGGSMPKVLQASEKACQKLLQALDQQNAYNGVHFVPRTGDVACLPYPELRSWEKSFAEASEAGAKQLKGHTNTVEDLVRDWLDETGPAAASLPFVVLDPNEVDCPLAYASSGFEEMTGHWRSWALGRSIRFLLLQDSVRNAAYNVQEMGKIDDFCHHWDEEEHEDQTRQYAAAVPGGHMKRLVWGLSRQSPEKAAWSARNVPVRELSNLSGRQVEEPRGTKHDDEMVSVLIIKGPKSPAPFWTVIYLQHLWLKDPGHIDPRVDQAYKHFIFCSFVPMTAQKAAIEDLLPWDFSKHSEHMANRIRTIIQERAQKAGIMNARIMANLIDEVVPDWLLEPSNNRTPSCTVGCQFVPRVGLRSVARFKGRWPLLLRSMESRLRQVLGNLPKDLFERTIADEEDGLKCWVFDPQAKDFPLVFFGKPLQKLFSYSSDQALARNARLLQPKMSRIDSAINGDERQRIEEFCKRCSSPDVPSDATDMSLLLLERKSGSRFFALQQMLYARDPENRQQGYVLGVLTLVDVKMPAVLQSHQISELQEDETGLALDEWGAFFANLRDEIRTSQDANEASRRWAHKLHACLRETEDYDGDHFVPRNGVVEVNHFQQSGVLKHVLKEIQEDCRHIFDCPTWDAEDREHVLSIADPSGEDCPLVYISSGFEEVTGYQRDWVLGRNRRFLQPKDQARNQQFNGDQLAKLEAFCRSWRPGESPNLGSIPTLLINETRSGSPFWCLSCLQLVEVLGRTYVITMSRRVTQEKVRLAELLCLDPEGLDQLNRLKSMLLRYEGGAKFTSLSTIVQQLLSSFMADFTADLKAPALSPGVLPMLSQISLFGMEVTAGNMKAMADALKSGLRHLHIALPSGPATKTAEEGAFVRKILPLKLAEVMNSFHQQYLHYIREATVITVRSPPHLLPVISEVRKTLLTHGYGVLCWLLDVRGCNTAETAQHWQALSQSRHPGEALGLYGGGPRMLHAAQSVRGSCPVSIYATEMHPGRKPDEQEVRMMGKLRGSGVVPMACNIFGPRDSWIHSAEAKAAAARIGLEPKMLALKWAEHRGFLAVGTSMLQGEPAENPVHMHRTFVRQYRAAPSAEVCMAALAGAQVHARTLSALTDSAQADTQRPGEMQKPNSARIRVMTAIEPSNATMAKPGAQAPKRTATSPEEPQKEKVQVQALPNVLERAKAPPMTMGVVSAEQNEGGCSGPPTGRASPGASSQRPPSRASSQRPPSRTDPEDDSMYAWDYDLPPRPSSLNQMREDMEAAKIPPPPIHAPSMPPPSPRAPSPRVPPEPELSQVPRLPEARSQSTGPKLKSAGARKMLTPRDLPWMRKSSDPRAKPQEGFRAFQVLKSQENPLGVGASFRTGTLFASKGR